VNSSTGHSSTRSSDRLLTSGGGLPKLAEPGPCDLLLPNRRVLQVSFIRNTRQEGRGSPRGQDLGADNAISSWMALGIPQRICQLPDYSGPCFRSKPRMWSRLFV
jgi:hypothetical protein